MSLGHVPKFQARPLPKCVNIENNISVHVLMHGDTPMPGGTPVQVRVPDGVSGPRYSGVLSMHADTNPLPAIAVAAEKEAAGVGGRA